jgi:hypothetical protein
MGDKEKDIFNISLNKDGGYWILRFCNIVQFVIFTAIVSGSISILHNVLSIWTYDPRLYVSRPALKFEYFIHPYFWIIYDIFWIVQLYFYFHFRDSLKKALENADSDGFNNSFSYMYRMTKISLVLIILSLISQGYSLFLHFKYHL